MSVANPAFRIPRRVIDQPLGEAGLWAKMFDPPKVSPMTPELLVPDNPVPQVMANAGLAKTPKTPGTLATDLMHGMKIPAWNEKEIMFFLFRQGENLNPDAKGGSFPGPTIRIPRGAIFHAITSGKGPPPHTIHWHGQEPTPLNDGVGHCSMEIGKYTYQFQPNAMGTYFYHCHRNTPQHFEFGLYGALLIDPPTAFFASLASPAVPIGQVVNPNPSPARPEAFHFRVQAALQGPTWNFSASFPGYLGGEILTKPSLAQTVPYDVEALWVFDDRDSIWSDFAPDARAFYPKHGNKPNIDPATGLILDLQDRFVQGFFNEFNADFWYITGVNSNPNLFLPNPGPIAPGPGTFGSIARDIRIPSGLNSGVGRVIGQAADTPALQTQVPINAQVGQTVLVRTINGAYDDVRLTLPFEVLIIAWDGRPLGLAPFGFNRPFILPANTPIRWSVARRFDFMFVPSVAGNADATCEFIRNHDGRVLHTLRVPITITAAP